MKTALILIANLIFITSCIREDDGGEPVFYEVEYENETNYSVTFTNFVDTSFTVGNGAKINTLTISPLQPVNQKYTITPGGFSVVAFFNGDRIEVAFSDGKKAYFNKPASRYPKSIDSFSVLPINPLIKPFTPYKTSGKYRYYKFVVTQELYNLAK